MRIKDRMIAGLCIMILTVPFYIMEYINDATDKADIGYAQIEESIETTEENDGMIKVYIAPTGKCYHFKKTCAGKNAIETTLDNNEKRACKKCVY